MKKFPFFFFFFAFPHLHQAQEGLKKNEKLCGAKVLRCS